MLSPGCCSETLQARTKPFMTGIGGPVEWSLPGGKSPVRMLTCQQVQERHPTTHQQGEGKGQGGKFGEQTPSSDGGKN